ncbi:MAG TPA: NAD(P)-dependent oxidoreductase [Micromonosporaceae bacterium]
MTTVAVIGLGAMGSRMARRFLDAGHQMIVWNRTTAKAAPLVALGARQAATPAAAAARAEIALLMVSDPAALRDVTEGPDGVARGAAGSTTVVQMSTVAPESVAALEAALPTGTPLLDAPVLGSLSETESGSLRIFVSGPADLARQWTPLFGVLGTPEYLGPLGAGSAAKLVANAALLGTLSLVGETLALAEGLDLPRDVAFEVLAATPLAAAAERRRDAVESGEFPLRFALALARKDADLILDAGAASRRDLRLLAAVRTWLADAERAGLADTDYSRVIGHILSMGGSGSVAEGTGQPSQ